MKQLLTTAVFTLYAVLGFAFGTPTCLSDVQTSKEYKCIRIVNNESETNVDSREFREMCGQVTFQINKFHIDETCEFAKELETEIIPLVNASNLKLVKMVVRGAASPEGPYDNNKWLSEQRSKNLFEFVNSRLKYPVEMTPEVFSTVAEDYEFLADLMAENNDAYYVEVKNLVNYCSKYSTQRELKQKLMKLDGGLAWKRMLRLYFPELRSARVAFFFKKVEEPKPAQQPSEQPATPLPPATVQPAEEPQTPAEEAGTQPTDTVVVMGDDRLHRRELISIKTNILGYGVYIPQYGYCPIPNIGIEYYPLHGHVTYAASLDFPWWQGNTTNHKYFQIRNYTLEGKYYLKTGDIDKVGLGNGPAFRGWYASVYANAFLYGIGFNRDKGWQGEGLGAGLGIGYVMPLGHQSRWKLEFELKAGFFWTKYDPYVYGCPVEQVDDGKYYYKWTRDADLFQKRQYRFTWLGPTRIGITITYDLLFRRINRKGISFNSTEPLPLNDNPDTTQR